MKVFFKKLFKWLALSVLSIVVLVGALSLLVLWKPQLLLTEKNIATVLEKISGPEEALKYKDLNFTVENKSWLRKRLSLGFKDLCIDYSRPKIKGCLEDFRLVIDLTLGKPFVLHEVEELTVKGEGLEILMGEAQDDEAPSDFNLGDWLTFENTKVGRIHIDLGDVVYGTGGTTFSGDIRLSDNAKLGESLKLELQSYLEIGRRHDPSTIIRANLVAVPHQKIFRFPLEVRGPVVVEIVGAEALADANLRATLLNWDHIEFAMDLDYSSKTLSYQGTAHGQYGPNRMTVHPQGYLELPQMMLSLGKPGDCRAELGFDGDHQVDCRLGFVSGLETAQRQKVVGVLEGLGVDLKANIQTDYFPSPESPWKGEVSIQIPSHQRSFAALEGNVKAKFEDMVLSTNPLEKIVFTGDLKLSVLDFRKMVDDLEGTAFVPPAPLNALKGDVTLRLDGKLVPGEVSMPFELITDLRSQHQSLVTQAKGDFGFKKHKGKMVPHLNAVAVLDDIKLVMPRLKLAKPPPLFPDSRIADDEKFVEEETSFFYAIEIQTPDHTPIQIVTNLAQAPIPILAQLHLANDESPSGLISIRQFPVELLRREATIEYVTLGFKPSDVTELSGRAVFEYTEYTVFVNLHGTTENPRIQLQSEPPLPEDQLWSTLLFGRPMDELDPDEAGSVGSTQAAAANRALTLTSLYLLASTPIESVGYNPEQGVFTARVRIDDGVSLNVGATGSGDVERVGLRKQLPGNWAIQTYMTNPSDRVQRSLTAFLEWFQRY